MMAEINDIRARGYALSLDRVAPGIGGVNVLLPPMDGTQPMAVAISSSSEIITREHRRFVDLVRDAVDHHLGRPAPPVAP